VWAAGSSSYCYDAGTYTLRIELVTSGHIRVDLVRFDSNETPATMISWGVMKSHYR
jgi:hypothetical protein